MSTVGCCVEKSLPITNETVLAAHINLSVDSACYNALYFTNDATRAHMTALCRLHTLCFIDTFVGEMPGSNKKDKNDDGKRYLALLYIKMKQ